MRCVVDDAQSELFGDSLQLFDSTRQSINVNTENARRAVCHETFNSSGVDRHTHWVDVGKNRCDPIPTDACGVAGNVNGVVMTSPERFNALQAIMRAAVPLLTSETCGARR